MIDGASYTASLVYRGIKEPQDIIEDMEREGEDWKSISKFMLRVASECGKSRYYNSEEKILNTLLNHSRKNGDRETESDCLREIGGLMRSTGQLTEAVKYYSEAAAISMEIKDAMRLGVDYSYIGEILLLIGDMEGALSNYRKAYESFQTWDDAAGLEEIAMVGQILFDLRRYGEAQKEFQEAIRISEKLGDKKIKSNLLCCVGNTLRWMGRLEEALEIFLETVRIKEEIGDRVDALSVRVAAGIVLLRLGRTEEALEQLNKALLISRRENKQLGEAYALFHIGISDLLLKNDQRANEAFEKAIQLFEAGYEYKYLLILLTIYLDHLHSIGATERAEEISRKISEYTEREYDDPYEEASEKKKWIDERVEELRSILNVNKEQ